MFIFIIVSNTIVYFCIDISYTGFTINTKNLEVSPDHVKYNSLYINIYILIIE